MEAPGNGCERKAKYICIECWNSICNICSVSVTSETKGYDEEEKKVALCQKCNTEKEFKIIKEHKANAKQKVVQQSIFLALKVKSTNKQNRQQHKATSQKIRTVAPATVEKRKSEVAVHSLHEWLTYSTDKVQSMMCTVCAKMKNKLKICQIFPTSLSKALRITER